MDQTQIIPDFEMAASVHESDDDCDVLIGNQEPLEQFAGLEIHAVSSMNGGTWTVY